MAINNKDPREADIVSIPPNTLMRKSDVFDVGKHSHPQGQLLYAAQGQLSFYSYDKHCLLTPNQAAWIPPGVFHEEIPNTSVICYSLFFNATYDMPKQIKPIIVSSFLKCLLLRYYELTNATSEVTHIRLNILQVIKDEINSRGSLTPLEPYPSNPRLKCIFDDMVQHPAKRISCNDFATKYHMSTRTLSRLCHKELGISFENWRKQVTLMLAMQLLSKKYSVTEVSYLLGYKSNSAFISMFKQLTGQTPAKYKKQLELNP